MSDAANGQDANPLVGTGNDATPQIPVYDKSKQYETFPYAKDVTRIQTYDYYSRLFLGDHFDAFNIKIANEQYTREYSRLRYVVTNIPGLISKVIADLLFSEPPNIKAAKEEQQPFVDAVVDENNLEVQGYESALSNSYMGDAVWKVRVGPRNPGDKESTVIIEDINPRVYFPQVNLFNVRGEPEYKELAWVFKSGDKRYLRREVHYVGYYENHIHLLEGDKIVGEVPLTLFPDLNLQTRVDTKIDRCLIVHIPNWKTNDRYWGLSDYRDLDKLFYALNNRMAKIDNILDKHSDPILMVPQGILDEDGKVRKKALGVVEFQDGENGKPEYIVWDASLENAFKEIDKIIENAFMIAEISPDILGMGKGQNDSGRAIKLKVLRTIAKAARKKLYYDRGLKEVIYIAQLMAKAWGVKAGKIAFTGEPAYPEIEWQDGLPQLMDEQVEIEAKRLDSGTTTPADAIMRLDDVDKDVAEKKAKEIKEANKLDLPTPSLSEPFGPKKTGDNPPADANNPKPNPPAPQPPK